MPIINWDTNLIFFIAVVLATGRMPWFLIAYTKCFVPVVTLLTKYNQKLLEQLKSGLKKTFSWNKYQSKVSK